MQIVLSDYNCEGQTRAIFRALVARHDRVISLVARMLDLHRRLAAEQTPHVKTALRRHADGGGDGPPDRRAGV